MERSKAVQALIDQIKIDVGNSLEDIIQKPTGKELLDFCKYTTESITQNYLEMYGLKRDELCIDVRFDKNQEMLLVNVEEKNGECPDYEDRTGQC